MNLCQDQTQKIMSMEREKRERVVGAAIKEFSKGYKQASTDLITRDAGISKGLLFHYFGSKKNLLVYVHNHVSDVIFKEFIHLLDFEEKDAISRIWKVFLVKLEVTLKYPMLFDFIGAIYMETPDELIEPTHELEEIRAAWWKVNGQLFSNIDVSLFETHVDVEKALDTMRLMTTGYAHQMLRTYQPIGGYLAHIDEVQADVKSYLDFFRTAFYKEKS